ncbi:MAG: type II secretion system F family protein [Planctomycetota bacterium]|jgi:type II secretory pathway component PulF
MSQLSFQYKAYTREGARTDGELQAADRSDAYRQLVASGMRPVKIRARRGRRGGRRRPISIKDLSHLTRQFAVLMEACIPIVDGLRSIAEQEPNPHVARVIEEVASQIESGSNITEAMSPHRDLFGDVYIESIRAAETSGNMVAVLTNLADIMERQYETTKAVKGALLYPCCVVAALLLAVTFLMIVVVPRFASMFASRGVALPLPTQIVVTVSDFMLVYWYVVLGVLSGGVWMLRRAWRNPASRRQLDGWLHRVPIIRPMLVGLAVSRFAHILGVTLRSGLSLIDALEMSGNASARPLLQADAEAMCDQVRHGGRLSDVLTDCTYLPPFARRMLMTGEEAADLSKLCDVVARHYDREVGYLTKTVTTALEPILIVGLAIVVLIIALAIFLPMWNMAALLG